MKKLTVGELQRLIVSINILDTYQGILFTIKDSKSKSNEMNMILNIIPDEKYVDETLEANLSILYDWAQNTDTTRDNLESVIRIINPGMIRMNLRTIYRNKE